MFELFLLGGVTFVALFAGISKEMVLFDEVSIVFFFFFLSIRAVSVQEYKEHHTLLKMLKYFSHRFCS